MANTKVLIADDDTTFCILACDLLRREGYDAASVSNTIDCEQALKRGGIQILMLDMCFPALKDGFEMLDLVKENYPQVVVLMISGEGNIPDAVSAIKNGAADFIEKPIAPEHLLLRLQAIVTRFEMEKKIRELSQTAIGMIGISTAMRKVYDEIIRTAQYDCTLLITGETGVGKELAAKAVHRLSSARNKELVIVNCGAIPKELFEAEFFGYEQGAFTGANKAHKGYFEYAEGGAVFLDEIGELPLDFQVKLLRVLSEGEIQKVGGRIQKVNTRVISASNKNLRELVSKGLFREDLLYRLNTLSIHIPPLRERPDDILPLVSHFINQVCAENSIAPMNLLPAAASWLLQQEWKGNVRELKNAIYRGVVFATTGQISIANLQQAGFHPHNAGDMHEGTLKEALYSFEKAYIETILKENGYSVPKAAITLHIDKSNLFKKLKALNIDIHRLRKQ